MRWISIDADVDVRWKLHDHACMRGDTDRSRRLKGQLLVVLIFVVIAVAVLIAAWSAGPPTTT